MCITTPLPPRAQGTSQSSHATRSSLVRAEERALGMPSMQRSVSHIWHRSESRGRSHAPCVATPPARSSNRDCMTPAFLAAASPPTHGGAHTGTARECVRTPAAVRVRMLRIPWRMHYAGRARSLPVVYSSATTAATPHSPPLSFLSTRLHQLISDQPRAPRSSHPRCAGWSNWPDLGSYTNGRCRSRPRTRREQRVPLMAVAPPPSPSVSR